MIALCGLRLLTVIIFAIQPGSKALDSSIHNHRVCRTISPLVMRSISRRGIEPVGSASVRFPLGQIKSSSMEYSASRWRSLYLDFLRLSLVITVQEIKSSSFVFEHAAQACVQTRSFAALSPDAPLADKTRPLSPDCP